MRNKTSNCLKCNEEILLIYKKEYTFCSHCGEKNTNPYYNEEILELESCNIFLDKAKTYLKNGDIEKTKAILETVLDIDQENEEAKYVLGKLAELDQMSEYGIDQIDELFKDIANYVVEQGKCSLNKITQVFGVGFNRATKIVRTLEQFGIVSANIGTKPRSILVDYEMLAKIFESIE